jgi:arabinofuranosyltransferase
MLMRYAWHAGHGLGYAWNPGEPPVDGATDWLSTTLLAGLYAMGVGLELGPRLLAGAAHLCTVGLVVGFLRRAGAPLAMVALAASVLITGPAKAYVQAGFLTPVFACAVLAAWLCIVAATERPRRHLPIAFALAALAATLARPEGIAVTVIMLAAAAALLDRAQARRVLGAAAFVTLPALVLFLAWRWEYFGRLLPLPFLKKGGGSLHPDGLLLAWRAVPNLLWWGAPFLMLAVSARAWRWIAALAIFVSAYLTLWLLLSPEMNLFWRFQYALVPVVLVTCWFAARDPVTLACAWLARTSRGRRFVVTAACTIGLAATLLYDHHRFRQTGRFDGTVAVARLLAEFGGLERTLVTTEAGLLPLYSGWRSVDAWGLNDPRVVADGLITDVYLRRRDPDVIVFHANYTPLDAYAPAPDPWGRMVDVLHRYAACNGYRLAAAFVPETSQAMYFFVKPEWADAGAFGRRLSRVTYRWPAGTAIAVDLAAQDRSRPPCQ